MARKALKIKCEKNQSSAQEDIIVAAVVVVHTALAEKFGICRICLRELAYKGEIPGMKKSKLVRRNIDMLTDPIADMLTRIRNANSNKNASVSMPSSTMKKQIAKILKEEGFISDYAVVTEDGKNNSHYYIKSMVKMVNASSLV